MILDFERIFYPNPIQGKPYDFEAMRKNYYNAFSSPHGQRVLEDIAKRGLLHTVSFAGEAPLGTAFNEGKRALALEIMYMLNPNPVHNITHTHGGTDDGNFTFD
jgi:hypothetical protein